MAIFADTQEEPQAVYDYLAWLRPLGQPTIWGRLAGKLGDDLLHGTNSTGQRFTSIPAFTAEDHNAPENIYVADHINTRLDGTTRRHSSAPPIPWLGCPARPICDFDWMPLHPSSQPSGPQIRLLKMLCLVSLTFQPSRTISGSPIGIGLSALQSHGKKTRLGTEQSQMPPWTSSDAAEIRAVVVDAVPVVEAPVAVGVLEHYDPVVPGAVELPIGVGQAFDDPQPPAVVEGHGDRLDDVRLAGE